MEQTTGAGACAALASTYPGPDRRESERRAAVEANERVRRENFARHVPAAEQRSAAEVLRAVVPQARAHFAGQYVPGWVTLMEAQVAQQEEAERRAIAADLANNVNKFAHTDRMAVEDEFRLARMAGYVA